MHSQNPPEYLGLTTVPGIASVTCPLLRDVACPFCANTDVAFLMGKVSFSATMSGDDLLGGASQPLAAVVCSKSHIFFLREQDTVQANDAAA